MSTRCRLSARCAHVVASTVASMRLPRRCALPTHAVAECISVYIYIYICIEREREIDRCTRGIIYYIIILSYICIYIYMLAYLHTLASRHAGITVPGARSLAAKLGGEAHGHLRGDRILSLCVLVV